MAMILYHGEPNGPSLTVLAALSETGVQADLRRIDLAAGERHGAAIPRNAQVDMSIEGEGPVLVAGGEAMADSVFLACYLDDVGAETSIRPTDPFIRWEMMSWCRYVIERIAPAAAFLGTRAHQASTLASMPDPQFEALAKSIVSDDLRERWAAVRAGHFPEAQVSGSEEKITEGVQRIEARLDGRDWLIGDFSLADLETYSWMTGMVALVPTAFADKPRTSAWLERVRARPSVADALAKATVADPRMVWAPGPEINRWG